MIKSSYIPIIFLFGILLTWEGSVRFLHVKEYILPSPITIAKVLYNDWFLLLKHTGITALESLTGFILANIGGLVLASLLSISVSFKKAIMPYAIALKTTPIVAFAPILVIWFGSGIITKIFASALVCFFPILVNTLKGLTSVEQDYLNLFASFHTSKWKTFWNLKFPTAMPYIFSALKISTSLSVVGAIVGEFVGASQGLGYIILVSSYHLETASIFAAIILSASIGIIFFSIISYLEKKTIFWQNSID
jgi:NitT/TauT family transport system permease protein